MIAQSAIRHDYIVPPMIAQSAIRHDYIVPPRSAGIIPATHGLWGKCRFWRRFPLCARGIMIA